VLFLFDSSFSPLFFFCCWCAVEHRPVCFRFHSLFFDLFSRSTFVCAQLLHFTPSLSSRRWRHHFSGAVFPCFLFVFNARSVILSPHPCLFGARLTNEQAGAAVESKNLRRVVLKARIGEHLRFSQRVALCCTCLRKRHTHTHTHIIPSVSGSVSLFVFAARRKKKSRQKLSGLHRGLDPPFPLRYFPSPVFFLRFSTCVYNLLNYVAVTQRRFFFFLVLCRFFLFARACLTAGLFTRSVCFFPLFSC
jgi:hypothetical protein